MSIRIGPASRRTEAQEGLSLTSRIERGLPWGAIGAILGILFGVPAAYELFRNRNPQVVFEVESSVKVLDVLRPVPDLTISFRNETLTDARTNFRVYRIQVRNDGGSDLLQEAFDQALPWGLKFTPGEIIEAPRVVASNSSYLEQNVSPVIAGPSTVLLNKVILEQGKYFTLELMLLHPPDEEPTINPLGKIAGQENQPVVFAPDRETTTFWQSVISGSIWVWVVRTVLIVLGVMGLVGLAVTITEAIEKAKRRRVLNRRTKAIEAILSDLPPIIRNIVESIARKLHHDPKILRIMATYLKSPDGYALSIREASVERMDQQARKSANRYGYLFHVAVTCGFPLNKSDWASPRFGGEIISALEAVADRLDSLPAEVRDYLGLEPLQPRPSPDSQPKESEQTAAR